MGHFASADHAWFASRRGNAPGEPIGQSTLKLSLGMHSVPSIDLDSREEERVWNGIPAKEDRHVLEETHLTTSDWKSSRSRHCCLLHGCGSAVYDQPREKIKVMGDHKVLSPHPTSLCPFLPDI